MRPVTKLDDVVSRQNIAPCISCNLARQPIGFRVGPDEDEETAALEATYFVAETVSNVDCLQVRVAMSGGDFGLEENADVGLASQLINHILRHALLE